MWTEFPSIKDGLNFYSGDHHLLLVSLLQQMWDTSVKEKVCYNKWKLNEKELSQRHLESARNWACLYKRLIRNTPLQNSQLWSMAAMWCKELNFSYKVVVVGLVAILVYFLLHYNRPI